MKIAYKTLGCKVNQYETFAIIEEFRKDGFEIVDFGEDADIYIINTCAVTHIAEKKSRQMIRHVAKKGYTIVTGCGVDNDPLSYFSIDGVDLVVGNAYKNLIFSFAKKGMRGVFTYKEWERGYTYFSSPPYAGKTRVYIKIQDGCNRFCTYCKIPYLRGNERSRDPEDVFFEVEFFLKRGYKEIILLGINVGTYNFNGYNLGNLIFDLDKLSGNFWLRLTSIEPEDVKPLLPYIVNAKKFVPHIHIPLQSGDNTILDKMHRGYTREFYRDVVQMVRESIEDVSITSDVIVGFPGEKEGHFMNTYNLIEELRLYKFHIFPYSRRKGTAAYYMKDNISKTEKTNRVKILEDLKKRLMNNYHKGFIGRKVEVLVEGEKDGMYYGMTPYYFKVYMDKNSSILNNSFYHAELMEIYRDGLKGKISDRR